MDDRDVPLVEGSRDFFVNKVGLLQKEMLGWGYTSVFLANNSDPFTGTDTFIVSVVGSMVTALGLAVRGEMVIKAAPADQI